MATPIKWGSEFLVNTTTTGNQSGPAVYTLAGNRSVVVWTDDSASGGDPDGNAVRAQLLNADGSKFGAEFLVNTTTAGSQADAEVTALAGGGFAVVWMDGSQTGGDSSGAAVRGQIFASDGTRLGGEFLVNSATASEQFAPAITTLADGRFAVTWTDQSRSGGDTSGSAIRGQLFNPDGSRSGSEFLVNSSTDNNQVASTIAGLGNGGFVVSWVDDDETPPSGIDVATDGWAQIFNADGSRLGGEFRINSHNTTAFGSFGPRQSYVVDPAVVALDDGRFVVAWSGYGTSRTARNGLLVATEGYEVLAQIFNPDGSKSGSEILIEARGAAAGFDPMVLHRHVDVTALPSGRFAITWTSVTDNVGSDASGERLHGELFNSNGTPASDRFQVNTTVAGDQFANAMTTLLDGRFLVVWTDASQSPDDPSGFAIRSQIFDPRDTGVTITGTPVPDTLYGGVGNDTIDGAAGPDRMIGGLGNDTYVVNDPGDQPVEQPNEGTDTVLSTLASYLLPANIEVGIVSLPGGATLFAHDQGMTLFGSGGNDVLIGGAGNDFFSGGPGDDYIDGRAGANMMGGNLGNDTYVVRNAADQVFENLDEGIDTTISLLPSYQLTSNVENGVVGLLTGATLTGNDLPNFLSGNNGSDLLNGGGGPDIMAGGFGDDIYYLNDPGDQIIEQPGQGTADRVVSLIANYTLTDNVEIGVIGLPSGASLAGNDQSNTLLGNDGNDFLDGKGGADLMAGGKGDDLYYVDDPGDVVSEQAGQGTGDMVRSFLATYTMTDNVEVGAIGTATGAHLIGNDQGVTLFGNVGGDMLYGGAGDDFFNAIEGNDWLIGQGGTNKETGGAGADHFVFTFGQGGKDSYTDFNGAEGDLIDLRNMAAAGVNNFNDLQARMSQQGSEVLIDFGGTDQIHVQNTALATLQSHPEYFLIA